MDLSWINNLALAGGVTLALYLGWRTIGGTAAPSVDADTLRDALARGAVVVDVRTGAEFSAGHVQGARNLPVDTLAASSKQLRPTTRPVLVYCRSGSRSLVAKGILEREGFESVIDLGSMSNAERALREARSRGPAAAAATP